MRRTIAALTFLGALAACNGPESLYNSLDDVPQLLPLTNTSYAVGDTLALVGKLGGPHGGLQITVGGVAAPLIAWSAYGSVSAEGPGVTANGVLDSAKVIVTQAMGLGPDRLVTVTLSGVTLNAGDIYISPVRPVPTRSDTLDFSAIAINYNLLPNGSDTLIARGDNQDGKIYFLAGDTLCVWQNGTTTVISTTLADQDGPFQITGAEGALNGFPQVDEAGRYLYASVITSDSTQASASNLIFRFIKIDLQSGAVQTLNRSVFNYQNTTPAYVATLQTQMTGPVGSVFLPIMSQVFPAANGTIYFVTDGLEPYQAGPYQWAALPPCTQTPAEAYGSAVGKIDATGNVTYIIKAACGLTVSTTTGTADLLASLNATHTWSWINTIDPDAGVAYASGAGTSANGATVPAAWATIAYDLTTRRVLGTFAPAQTANGGYNAPTSISGPFAAVNGNYSVMGLVAGGGHRLWVAVQTATLVELEVVDFDAQTVSPYVATSNFPQLTTLAILNQGLYFDAIVNHTPDGNPLIADQGGYGSEIYTVAPPGSSPASRAASARHPRTRR